MFNCFSSESNILSRELFDDFETIFKDFELFWNEGDDFPMKSFKNIYPGFPPTDVYIKKDKTLVLELAISGYTEDLVDLKTEDDKLVITLSKDNPHNPTEDKEERKYLQKGIKHSKCKASYLIPTSKYKIDEVKANLKEGLLRIEVPAKEEVKPKKVEINV